jgi:hypothetical protein
MGQRAYANVTALVGSMKSLRESLGLVQDAQGKWQDATGRNVDGLNRFQLQIGATIDGQNRLVDAQGRLIDGLQAGDVALGRYIDSQGRLRDSQDRIIEGLNAQQKAAGMYKDELGNLYDAQNKVIQSAAGINQSHRVSTGEAVKAAKGLGRLVATMTVYTGTASPAAKASVALAAGLQAGTMAMRATESIAKVVSVLRTVEIGKLWAQFTAQQALNGATGNFVGIAAGIAAGAAAAGVAYAAMSKQADSATESINRLHDAGNKKFAGGNAFEFMDGIADRFKSDFEKTNAKLQEEIDTLKEIAEFSLFEKPKTQAIELLAKLQKQQRDLLDEEVKRAIGYGQPNKEREDAQKWIADQAKRAWTESQRIREDLDKAQQELAIGTKGAAEAVAYLQSQYDGAAEREREAAKKQRFGGMEDVIKKSNEAAMTLAEKELALSKAYEDQIGNLRGLFFDKDITSQEFDYAQKYLAAELKKQTDALRETPFDRAFKEMFELRVPLEDRVKEAFDKIKEAGERMGANADEIAELQKKERERLEKLYDKEEKNKKETIQKKSNDGGSFAVAGTLEAYRISTAASQKLTTKAIEKMHQELRGLCREITSNQRELNNKIEV